MSIPDIPLTIDPQIAEVLEAMKYTIDQLTKVIDPKKLPTSRPAVTGIVWSDNGQIKVS